MEHLKGASLRSSFTREHQTRLEKLARDKHSSLLQKFITYGRKKFYNIGNWSFHQLAIFSAEIKIVTEVSEVTEWELGQVKVRFVDKSFQVVCLSNPYNRQERLHSGRILASSSQGRGFYSSQVLGLREWQKQHSIQWKFDETTKHQ